MLGLAPDASVRVAAHAPQVPVAPAATTVTAPASDNWAAAVGLPSGARFTVVPVAASPDPLVDTVPHPIVKMFPLPVAEPVPAPGDADRAVFAEVDAERQHQATAELAAGPDASSYQGRHSA